MNLPQSVQRVGLIRVAARGVCGCRYTARRAARSLGILVFCALLAIRAFSANPTTLLTDNDGISGFELFGNGIYWWDGPGECSGEFPHDSTIRMRGTLSGATKNLVNDCRVHQDDIYNAARDEAYIYFFRQGVLHRKAVNAAEGDAPSPVPAPGGASVVTLASGHLSAYVIAADGQLYWSRFNPSTAAANIQRMPADGSANPTTVASITGGDEVVKMRLFTYRDANDETIEALALLMSDGRLLRRNLNRSTGAVTLGTGIADFAIHKTVNLAGSVTYIYAAKSAMGDAVSPSAPAGTLLRINASTLASTTIYTASGRNQIMSVATDSDTSSILGESKNLYITEGRVECGDLFCRITDGSIRRHSLPGSTSGWDLIVASGAGGNLRSDDQTLYFQGFASPVTRIRRISTDAPTVELRIKADDFEVVQNSQDLDNSIRLVANKKTFVRGYAHLTTNTTGKSTWFPSATLAGTRGGLALPGSPLNHLNNASIKTTANLETLRGDLNSSFLFELPDSWVTAGSIVLTFVVNSSGGIPETGPSPTADNGLIAPFTFTKKDRPCLVLVPMATTAPRYDPAAPGSGLPQILARTRSLLPVEDFKIFPVNEPIFKLVFSVEIEWLPCLAIPPVCPIPVVHIDAEPFNMDSDDNWALFWLTFAHIFSSDPDGCDDTHWVGTVHKDISKFNGIGGRSDLNLTDISADLPDIPIPDFGTANFLVARMEPGNGPNTWDSPLGGRTLAHELGHNYGRKHIDQVLAGFCGTNRPPEPWDTYPFSQCTIGLPAGHDAVFGFDPINQTVLPPAVGGDLMSYSITRWISKFTWDAIFDKVLNVPGLSLSGTPLGRRPLADPANQPLLAINGFVSPRENLASIRPGYVLPPGTADRRKVVKSLEALADMPAQNPYRVRLLTGAGNVLAEYPLLLAGQADGSSNRLGFAQFVPWLEATRSIQLIKSDLELANTPVSPSTPVISLSPPVVDEAGQFIDLSWAASDPDNDPLLFTIQYSANHGSNWLTLRLHYPYQDVRLDSSMLPGSPQARLRVFASDGIKTAMAISAPFTLAAHAPRPVIEGVTENELVPFQKTLQLEGLAFDAEDGSLPAGSLEWTLAGPTVHAGKGPSLYLDDLAPGAYLATLTGRDSAGQAGVATKHFGVLPLLVPNGSGIVLDGACSDSAYTNAAFIRIRLGSGDFARARLVHADGRLYVSLTDLKYGGRGNTSVGLRIDVNASRESTPRADDIGFYVDEDGIQWQVTGNGTTMPVSLSPKLGFSSAVVRGSEGWCAELCIDESLLGGWNHPAGLMIHHDGTTAETTAVWPPNGQANVPASWTAAYFGAALPALTNRPPVALAGPDQTVKAPATSTVYLDGSASYDPDGDPITSAWTQVAGPAVSLQSAASMAPHFQAGPVETETTLRFQLVVRDQSSNSAPAEVKVTLLPSTGPVPSFQVTRSASRLTDGGFSGRLFVQPEQRYQLQASTNLLQWTTLTNVVSDFFGTLNFTDPDAHLYPRRFYRGVKP